MIALDTNILIRAITQDNEKQLKIIHDLFIKTIKNKKNFFVSLFVTAEIIYVLESSYKYNRTKITKALEYLFSLNILKFENKTFLLDFINKAKNSTLELSDLLIGLSGSYFSCKKTLTFDKKASKSNLFELLK